MKRKPKAKWRPEDSRGAEGGAYPEFTYLDPRLVAAILESPSHLRVWESFARRGPLRNLRTGSFALDEIEPLGERIRPLEIRSEEELRALLEDVVFWLPHAAQTLRRILAAKFPGHRGRPRRTIQEVWDAPSIACYNMARAYCDRGEPVETHWKEILQTAAVKEGWERSNPYSYLARAARVGMKAKVKTRLLREGHWIKKNTIDIS